MSSVENITVIIPAYNAARYVCDTIKSVLCQTISTAPAIMVIDDGSTDDSLERIQRAFPQVQVVSQINSGQGSARQAGFLKATAEYLLFLDADDQLEPDSLVALTEALNASPEASLAYGRVSKWDGGENLELIEDANLPGLLSAPWEKLLTENFIPTPGCVLIRNTALRDAGGWDGSRKYQGCEDWELWLRLADIGPFVHVDQPVLRYRQHDAGYSQRHLAMIQSMFAVFRKQKKMTEGNIAKMRMLQLTDSLRREYAAYKCVGAADQSMSRGSLFEAIKYTCAAFRFSTNRLALLRHRLGALAMFIGRSQN